MFNNTKLKSSLQALAQSTLALYYMHLPPDILSENEGQFRAIKLMDLDSKVKESPIFAECVKLMEKDEHIIALNDKLVGTSNQLTIIKDVAFIILSFLRQLYTSNPTYDPNAFDIAAVDRALKRLR